jgi:hypothetical protein
MTVSQKSKVKILLLTPAKGVRFDSEPGDVKSISWRGPEVPRTVVQARAGEAIDWGGCWVPARGYAVLLDQPTS